MKKILLPALAATLVITAGAQNGKENVDQLCGCFEVSFKYAETFSPNQDYKFHEREQILGITELALPIINTKDRVVIQHLLIVGGDHIVKHWREEWRYENPVQWVYKGDKVWEKTILSKAAVEGKWSQSIWEVTDAPRYQGASPWQTVDGHTQWESTTDAPLPRREYTRRSDYNILNRTNRLVITQDGYYHVQDNRKLMRQAGKDQLIVEEKGLNGYVKLADQDCVAAQQYWETHQGFWMALQQEWDRILNAKTTIHLTEKVGDTDLMTTLFKMADEWKAKTLTANEVNAKIAIVLGRHLQ